MRSVFQDMKTAIVEAVILWPLPYREPDRIVAVWEARPAEGQERFRMAAGNFNDVRSLKHLFENGALFGAAGFRLLGEGAPEQILGARVEPEYFQVLGVHPSLGRAFTPEDAREGAARVVIHRVRPVPAPLRRPRGSPGSIDFARWRLVHRRRRHAAPSLSDLAAHAGRPQFTLIGGARGTEGDAGISAQLNVVTSGFFRAAGMRLRHGRMFEATDDRRHPGVAVVSESFAQVHLGGETAALGGRLRSLTSSYMWSSPTAGVEPAEILTEFRIVGVVADTRTRGLDQDPAPIVYLPAAAVPAIRDGDPRPGYRRTDRVGHRAPCRSRRPGFHRACRPDRDASGSPERS